MPLPPREPPFFRIGPSRAETPIVLSIPHAGRDYSDELIRAARVPLATLETLEDRLVDRLAWRAIQTGAVAVVARAPRAEIDLNRDEREIDPALIAPPPASQDLIQSARTRGGLGLIPSRIAGAGSIWRQRIKREDLARRIAQIHEPYHTALADALATARGRFGIAILLDCHSMPPRDTAGASGEAGVVFGDRHGTAMGREYLDAALSAARGLGYSTACNAPYAGGYVVTRHGRPQSNIHAVQIEIDRSLYLDAQLREPGKGFDAAAQLLATVAQALADKALEPPSAIAAE